MLAGEVRRKVWYLEARVAPPSVRSQLKQRGQTARLLMGYPAGEDSLLQSAQQSYSHRGDRLRRMDRLRKVGLVVVFLGAVALIPREQPRNAEASENSSFSFGSSSQNRQLRAELDATKGALELANAQLTRACTIMDYSTRYKVGADLAGSVYDVAVAEGIDPELGFRLVRVESEFNPHATSTAGAIGLTQLMPATARYFDSTATKQKLYNAQTNLHLGFRYLRSLIDENHGNVNLALLVYNRGPQAVETLQSLGMNPSNGYEHAVMKGYRGTGLSN